MQKPLASAVRLQLDVDASDLPEGALLWRWYRGRLYCVEIVYPVTTTQAAGDRGWWRYRYLGRRWRTLSAVARLITGDPTMSGNRFFGLRRRRGRCRAKLLID
jgi:hypothetical protein